MRSFSSTELKQTLGDVLDAATHGPIVITKHKKPRFVLLRSVDGCSEGWMADFGPVTLSCRSKCSFKPPFVRKRRGFSSPVLSGGDVDCRSR